MNQIERIEAELHKLINELFKPTPEALKNITYSLLTDTTKPEFGDITTNAAMVLAKQLSTNPRQIATEIISNFKDEDIEKIEIAGAGFINIFLKKEVFKQIALDISKQEDSFFKAQINNEKINLEFVSANPTGPLHIGHGRGGIIGDVFANIIRFLDGNITKEFYINDAGQQINMLGQSLKIRCLQEINPESELSIPEGGYQGAYLVDLAKECVKQYGPSVVTKNDAFFADYAKENLLGQIEQTLKSYGIIFDVWFSEKKLHDKNEIHAAIDILKKNGFTYEAEDALWFKSTDFGDDKDRVLIKNDGQMTYVAADIAYMLDKFARGYEKLLMILGQDHHSYVVRLKGICQALGHDPNRLDIILYQLVSLKEGGQALRMSKRAGRGITLQDVIDIVGKDVARFFYLNKKADAHLELDLDLALKKTDENPVFYIQYAYVRAKSMLEKAKQVPTLTDFSDLNLEHLDQPEIFLIKKIFYL